MKILATLGDSLIVGINGRLRVVDIKKRPCQGYATGCMCKACKDRERYLLRKAHNLDAQKAAKCECGGAAFEGDGQLTCWKCGRQAAVHA